MLSVERKPSLKIKMKRLLTCILLQLMCQLVVPTENVGNRVNITAGGDIKPQKISSAELTTDYVTFSDYQVAYKVHEELATWNEARERCMVEGAHLAIADSRDKIMRIMSISNQSQSWMHVGIYKSASSDQWIRADNGIPVTFVPWAYTDPHLIGSCAGISLFQYGLVNYLCTGKREYFVCEIPITVDNNVEEFSTEGRVQVEMSTKSPSGTLPEGYVTFFEDWAAYKVHENFALWTQAQDICISEGGNLAVIDSYEKIRRIVGLKNDWKFQRISVGIHKSNATSQWVRIDNGLPVTSVPWDIDEPTNLGDCTFLNIESEGLLDFYCDSPAGHFVCEISITDDTNIVEEFIVQADNTTSTLSFPFTRPEGYVTFLEDQAAYKVHENFVLWTEARDICISEGGSLAVTDSHEKIERILNLKNDWKFQRISVGIHKSNATRQWVRTDNDLPVPSVPWDIEEPTNLGDCTFLNTESKRLLDFYCDSAAGYFVCEISITTDKNIVQ